MQIIGNISLTFILLVYSTIINGWAVSKLWAWFIAATFGQPLLSIPQSIGLAMFVSYITYQIIPTPKDDREYWEKLVEGAILATFKPLFVLFFALIVKAFI